MSGERLRARREDLLVVFATGLVAAVLCFVRPTIFESADYVQYWKPTFQFLADAVRAGRIPLWNPYVGLGRPFLADMQNAVFYPPVYLVCLGETTGVFVLVWLHGLLAVFGMRRLASALHIGRWQGYFMAFSFLVSGPLTARWVTGQITYCWGLSYLPWLFYFALRTEESWQRRRIALYAGCLALQFLCGHPQVFWFSAIGQAAFIFTRTLGLPLRKAIRDAGQGLCQFGAACVWCAGLVAAVFLPMLELAKESNRSGNSLAFVNSYNLSWGDFEGLLGPLDSRLGWEGNLFVGALVVVSGCGGLCLVRERNVRGLLGVLVVSVLIALGDRTPLFGFFYKWLPGFAGFRIHARAGLLVVLVLICAAGIWLSRPHPFLRAAWFRLFGAPIRYAIIGLVLLQTADLLEGTWEIKRIITYGALIALQTPVGPSFVRTLNAELRKAGLMKPLRPPPRVCVPPILVPVNSGMTYRYSHFDANCSLFLRRPWDYLHTVVGIPPEEGKGAISPQVYTHGPFPYPDLGLSVGFDSRNGELVVNTNPAPRAFLVNAAETADYGTILDRLAHGYDIHRCALLEKPLAEPLPQEGSPPGAASIRRFEPESLLIEVEAKGKALLVLAEAWYPGWRAEIDGRAGACVAANLWMRAVPVPAGRHEVRLYFHQNYLLPGLLISLASASLLLTAVLARPARRANSGPDQQDRIDAPTATATAENGDLKQEVQSLTARPSAFPMGWQLLRAPAAGALVVWLVAMTGTLRVRSFNRAASECEASNHFRIAETFAMQGQTGQAITHFTEGLRLKPDSADALNIMAWIRSASPQTEFRDGPEAVRLAERACQLTDYKVPLYVGTLATALDHLAWIRSVSPRAELRDGPEAVRLAERACQLTDYKVPLYVGTLATALNNLARMRAASSQADLSEAVRLAERACQLTGYQVPLHVQTLAGMLNNLAFLRAASPQAELRDGPEAVRLAERACQLTGYQVPKLVGTLAAAYAEAGRFDEAVTTAVRERELAMARGESELAERTLKIIELYKARQPVRDADLRDEPRRVVPRP